LVVYFRNEQIYLDKEHDSLMYYPHGGKNCFVSILKMSYVKTTGISTRWKKKWQDGAVFGNTNKLSLYLV